MRRTMKEGEKLHGVHVKWKPEYGIDNEIVLCDSADAAEGFLGTLTAAPAVSEAALVVGTVEWRAAVD